MMTTIKTNLSNKITVNKFSFDFTEEYNIDKNTPWVNDLLVELEQENDSEEQFPEGKLDISIQISRKKDTFYKEHLLIKADLKACFHQPCGLCLHPLKEELDLSLKAVFLHESFEKLPEFEETTSIFLANEDYELYFSNKGIADIQEFLHEQIFIEATPFPRCTGTCVNPVYF